MRGSVLISIRVAAPPDRAFAAFTDDIASWWVPDPLFEITPQGDGRLSFEGGPGGRLVAVAPDGAAFTVGAVLVWDAPRRLVFSWRHASFAPEMRTEVEVLFEPVGDETRVTVVHAGWTSIPRAHVARHGFPDWATQQRVGEWWRRSLERLRRRAV